MANDLAITTFKNELIRQIQDDEEIVSALGLTPNEDAEDLTYVRLFPYYFVIPTQEEAKTYILVEVATQAIQDRFNGLKNDIVYDKATVYIYIIAHQNAIKMEEAGISAVRTDYISQLLSKKFNGARIAGLGALQKISNTPRSTFSDTYRMRELVFEIPDFNKEMCMRD